MDNGDYHDGDDFIGEKNDNANKYQVSSLKVARTEHVMSLIYGVPTIIGWSSSFSLLSISNYHHHGHHQQHRHYLHRHDPAPPPPTTSLHHHYVTV